METAETFAYADCCCREKDVEEEEEVAVAPSESTRSSSVAESNDDNSDHIYKYVARREPDPARDAQPVVAFAYSPQNAYAYFPLQMPVPVTEDEKRCTTTASARPTKQRTVALAPVVSHPVMVYAAHTLYAYGYAMPNHAVPVARAARVKSAVTTSAHGKGGTKTVEKPSRKVWVGRTKKQVDEDNIKIAVSEHLYCFNSVVPKDVKPDQLFWVIETDGSNTLRTFYAIDSGGLGKGVWKIDPRYGNAYFVRAREDSGQKKRCKK
ncbi:hypothetical protein AAFC00_000630 [Neodothiora populina]|uniref:Uncharacterized protein n=1 Tax=Neodothiora populina TaxID=2781224 RepID=A0ABR3PE27_9PEZI